VLLDVFGADPTFGPSSRTALAQCIQQGQIVACDVVWAETAASFPTPTAAAEAMHRIDVRFSPLDEPAALGAATAWRTYRRSGGSRTRVVADFLIAAHAQTHADRLLTRDRGFYRSQFADLAIVDPTGG
jgi:predicted nucleic acid-binding protein